MSLILWISIIIILIVLGLSVLAITSGYSYKHKVDPLPEQNKNDANENG